MLRAACPVRGAYSRCQTQCSNLGKLHPQGALHPGMCQFASKCLDATRGRNENPQQILSISSRAPHVVHSPLKGMPRLISVTVVLLLLLGVEGGKRGGQGEAGKGGWNFTDFQ